MDRCEVHTKFWSENMKGRNHLEDLSVEGGIMDVKGVGWVDSLG
jgi:hypothetical protein